jgi:hypothetical protein
MTTRFSTKARRAFLSLSGWLLLAMLGLTPMVAQAETLSDLQWQKRPLLVFAPTQNDVRLQEQIGLLKGAIEGLNERDVHINFISTDEVISATEPRLEEKSDNLRKRFDISDSFAVLLVGKDGTVKLRDTSPVEPKKLFQTIDAMPMRQKEMK